jgi:hypothetical protein
VPSRVKRTRDGRFALRISPAERDVLRKVPQELRELWSVSDPSKDPDLRRLFPPAYLDDPERSAEYDVLVRDDLLAGRVHAADVMERTIDAQRLSEEEIGAWMTAINDLRLVLGTRLDVPEDVSELDFGPDDPRAPQFTLYAYLSMVEEDIVAALLRG